MLIIAAIQKVLSLTSILQLQWVTSLFGLVRGRAFWLRPNTNLSAQLWS